MYVCMFIYTCKYNICICACLYIHVNVNRYNMLPMLYEWLHSSSCASRVQGAALLTPGQTGQARLTPAPAVSHGV